MRKLRYLVEYTTDPSDPRHHEVQAIEADVADIYSFVSKEDKMKSYTVALEMAIGRRQKDFAISALRSHASMPLYPPCLSQFDFHVDQSSVSNPVEIS